MFGGKFGAAQQNNPVKARAIPTFIAPMPPAPVNTSVPTMLEPAPVSTSDPTMLDHTQPAGPNSEQTQMEEPLYPPPKRSQTAVTMLSIPPQDLSTEKLLSGAPKQDFETKMVPSLGGIPLLAKLGQGGMGAVYYGFHPSLLREVAVKVLPFHLAERQPDMIDRFFREARIAASIKSPFLVSVTDAREEQGLCYLVMEFVSGPSAGGYMKKSYPRGLSEDAALDICIAATQGLMAAHEEGIIHRDIKPDNILLPGGKNGKVPRLEEAKLADLGLARSEEHGQSLTGSQTAMGTPGYMAPEQAMDARKCGKPADIFSMGATLYALLTGRSPFHGPAGMEIILATMQKPHERVTSIRPEVSAPTASLIDRCLEKQAQHRYRDAATLLSALRACRAALGKPLDIQNKALAEIKAGWTQNTVPVSNIAGLKKEDDDLGLGGGSTIEVTGVRAQGLLRVAERPPSNSRMLLATALLAGFVGTGLGLWAFGPKEETVAKPPVPVEMPAEEIPLPAAKPKPVETNTNTGPKTRFDEVMENRDKDMARLGKSLDRALGVADQQKIVAPVLPISSVPVESTARGYSSAELFLNLILGVVGMSYAMYGRKKPDFVFIFAGCGLTMFGWFVSSVALTFIVGGVLISVPFFLQER